MWGLDEGWRLFVVVMAFDFDDEDGDGVVVDVVDDAVVGCQAAGVCHPACSFQWFGMSCPRTWMLLQFWQKTIEFLERGGIGLFPLPDDVLGVI